MDNLQIFENEDLNLQIRTVEIDGKTYFVGKDVAKALGYKNLNDAISRHCKGVVKYDFLTNGGKQLMNVITEGDLYRLITNSELPYAEKFESWIFDEVLPSIRKHGAYMTPEKLEEAILNPDMMIKLCTALKDEQDKNKALQEVLFYWYKIVEFVFFHLQKYCFML